MMLKLNPITLSLTPFIYVPNVECFCVTDRWTYHRLVEAIRENSAGFYIQTYFYFNLYSKMLERRLLQNCSAAVALYFKWVSMPHFEQRQKFFSAMSYLR